MKQVTCMVQARLASERVKHKMIRPFADSCLLEIALKKLQSCDFLDQDRLYLSAYDPEIKAVGKKLGVQVYNRTYESTLEPNTMDVLYQYLDDIESEYILEINPCNPMLEAATINKALQVFQENDYSSLFSVVERRNFFFDEESKMLNNFLGDKKYIPTLETNMVGPIYEAAHCIYLWRAERVKLERVRWSLTKNDPFLFEITPEEAFDIDFPWQFELGEYAYIQRYGKANNEK